MLSETSMFAYINTVTVKILNIGARKIITITVLKFDFFQFSNAS